MTWMLIYIIRIIVITILRYYFVFFIKVLSVDKETTGNGDHSGNGPRERSDVSSLNDDGEYDNEENREIDVEDRERKQLQNLEGKSDSKENAKWWLEKW